MSEPRAFFTRLHRWAGLTIAGFLIVVGLTGAALSFFGELNRWLTPHLFPPPKPGVILDAATLARRAEKLAPEAQVNTIYLGNPGTVVVGVSARSEATALTFNQLFLDPSTGEELGRRKIGDLPRRVEEIMPFIYRLHMTLAADELGSWLLGLTALIWSLDCFFALYLTLPPSGERARKSFLARWKPAWVVKTGGSFYRINFDLHRAGGLWFWALLFIFAWSSVYMNLDGVYSPAMSLLFDYEAPFQARSLHAPALNVPPLSWEAAQAQGRELMQVQANAHGFTVEREVALYILRDKGVFEYRVRSSRDIGDKYGQTSAWFDATTGELRDLSLPTGQRAGNTVTTWLYELHKANLWGVPYKIVVSLLGVVIAMLSVTGFYIWWKKRAARKAHDRRASAIS